MEYISMSIAEALHYQSEYKHFEGKKFVDKESGNTYVVAAILVSPANADLLKEFTGLISGCDVGLNTLDEVTKFSDRYKGSEFTAVVFARKVSSQNQGHIFLPAQILATQSGIEIGFYF